jgi:hypothetical protein
MIVRCDNLTTFQAQPSYKAIDRRDMYKSGRPC